MRIFLQYILPLAFPAALYMVWGLYHKRKAGEDSTVDFTKGPWIKLFCAGIALTLVGLVIMNQVESEAPGGVYQPPVLKDGKIVPGHVIRED